MKTSLAFLAALLLSIAACAVSPPPEPPLPAAAPGSATRGPALAGSRPVAAKGPLTLEQCLEEALARNPGIAALEHEREAARARHAAARAERWPTADVVLDYHRTLDDQRLLPPRGPTDPGTWADDLAGADLVVRLPLYTGGRLTSEIRAADLLARAAEHRLARTREELVFDVTSLFVSILAQEKVIEAVRFSRRALQEHLKRVNDLIAHDRAARVDKLHTQVRIADVVQRLVTEENRLEVQRRALGNLLGREGAVEVRGALAEKAPCADLRANLTKARKNREDRRAAVQEVEALRRRIESARSGGRPSVFLEGSYGGRWAEGGTNRMPGAARAEDAGRVGVVVDIPLFRGGRVAGRVREARERFLAAREALRALDLRIRLEVETAVLDVMAARARVAATREAVAQAKESLRIERERYTVGKGSITDVLDAQSALLDSETHHDLALAALGIARARLDLATGERR